MKRTWMIRPLAAGLLMATAAANAAFFDPNLPGTTDFDGWDNLSITNPQIAGTTIPFPFPGFPGAGPWPTAIDSDAPGSGDAEFDKVSGFGYPASSTIYSSPFGNGIFSVADATPVAGLETVVFQLEIGAGSSGFLAGDPTLTVNGGTPVALADSGYNLNLSQGNPFGGGSITVPVFNYQWDVSGLGPITDFDIQFGLAGTSATIWSLQLDQGSEFTPLNLVQIPEPTSLASGLALLLAAACRRR